MKICGENVANRREALRESIVIGDRESTKKTTKWATHRKKPKYCEAVITKTLF